MYRAWVASLVVACSCGSAVAIDASDESYVLESDVKSANAWVYLGSCTWGNTSISSCTHRGGNALASFYRSTKDKKVYVYNRVTKSDVNYCNVPKALPAETLLRPATVSAGYSWLDEGAAKRSGMTLLFSTVNQVQASTNSYNYKQTLTGRSMTIYAPCYLTPEAAK